MEKFLKTFVLSASLMAASTSFAAQTELLHNFGSTVADQTIFNAMETLKVETSIAAGAETRTMLTGSITCTTDIQTLESLCEISDKTNSVIIDDFITNNAIIATISKLDVKTISATKIEIMYEVKNAVLGCYNSGDIFGCWMSSL